VDVVEAGHDRGQNAGDHRALPRLVVDGLVPLDLDGAEPLPSPQVLRPHGHEGKFSSNGPPVKGVVSGPDASPHPRLRPKGGRWPPLPPPYPAPPSRFPPERSTSRRRERAAPCCSFTRRRGRGTSTATSSRSSARGSMQSRWTRSASATPRSRAATTRTRSRC